MNILFLLNEDNLIVGSCIAWQDKRKESIVSSLHWLVVDEKYSQTGKLFPVGSFGHCGHSGQSIFFNREKKMCVVILTNATRFLSKRSGFEWHDYNVICEMRKALHNEILKDLSEQGLM